MYHWGGGGGGGVPTSYISQQDTLYQEHKTAKGDLQQLMHSRTLVGEQLYHVINVTLLLCA